MLTLAEGASLTLDVELAVLEPQNVTNRPGWFDPIGILSSYLSLAVNAIFTDLLVFKIAKASLALRHTHAKGIPNFTPVISLLIERIRPSTFYGSIGLGHMLCH